MPAARIPLAPWMTLPPLCARRWIARPRLLLGRTGTTWTGTTEETQRGKRESGERDAERDENRDRQRRRGGRGRGIQRETEAETEIQRHRGAERERPRGGERGQERRE